VLEFGHRAMLTKLEADGFKNLRKVAVYLGPFTCIAGPNGVGKSNLFDSIAFLSALAQMPLMDAALSVRGGAALHGDVRNLFHRVGDRIDDRMSFAVEMLIPEEGEDELGQRATASMTFLRYELRLRFREDPLVRAMGTLTIEHESLVHLNKTEAKQHLPFPHSTEWRDSVVRGRRTSPYISMDRALVSLHADSIGGKGGGRPSRVPAGLLPRTMLSTVTNAAEHRTLVLARKEMSSWTQLYLEPTALRAPDSLTAPHSIGPRGLHLPATLYALARSAERERPGGAADLYARIANRLSELVENVRDLSVDVDEKRQLLSTTMTDRFGTVHVASALSDGTLRFLALAVMEADPRSGSLICLEEPENGIHPERIAAVILLLGDLAVDVAIAVDASNPLRQVIINTHSPSVVACVDEGALLAASEARVHGAAGLDTYVMFHPLPNTWRSRAQPHISPMPVGALLSFLDPLSTLDELTRVRRGGVGATRVFQRNEVQLALDLKQRKADA
jgi:predicted ATPase